jgi:hypothetical protein
MKTLEIFPFGRNALLIIWTEKMYAKAATCLIYIQITPDD